MFICVYVHRCEPVLLPYCVFMCVCKPKGIDPLGLELKHVGDAELVPGVLGS